MGQRDHRGGKDVRGKLSAAVCVLVKSRALPPQIHSWGLATHRHRMGDAIRSRKPGVPRAARFINWDWPRSLCRTPPPDGSKRGGSALSRAAGFRANHISKGGSVYATWLDVPEMLARADCA